MKRIREIDDGDDTEMCVDNFGHKTEIINGHVYNEKEAHQAVAKFVITAGLQPQSVEEEPFKALCHNLNPKFYIDFPILERECMNLYEEEKVKVKQFLKDFDGQISLSMDLLRNESWDGYFMDIDSLQDYMCLSAHFIDDNWKLKKWIIDYRRIWTSTPDGRIWTCPDEAIKEVLSDLEIEDKISTLTLANTDASDECFEIVKICIQEKKKLQLNGKVFRVYCCADIFRVMVEDAFEIIDGTIRKISLLVIWGRKSLPKWDVTLSCLQDALDLESKGEYAKKDDYEGYEIPSAEEWKRVGGVCKLAESIYKVAYILFETDHPTANIYLHLLQELHKTLTQESTSSDEFISFMAKRMLKKFNKYWKDIFLVLAIATVLDPRFKMKYIGFSCSKYEDNVGNPQATTVLEAIRSLFNDYASSIPETKNPVSDSTPSHSEEDSPDSESEDEFPKEFEEQCRKSYENFNLFQEYCQLIQSTSQPAKSELDWYLEEPVLPWNQDFDALSWWRNASAKYPILSRMARDFLAIPVSLAASTDSYHSLNRRPDYRVVSLEPDLVNALMCTQSWFQGQ